MDKTVNFSPEWKTIAVREEFRVSVIMQRGSGSSGRIRLYRVLKLWRRT